MHPDRYVGRCLGLITNEQLAALKANKDLWRKIRTSPSLPLISIDQAESVTGKRLAVALKKKNGEDVYSDQILVTDELDYVRSIAPEGDNLQIECRGGSVWYSITQVSGGAA